MKLAAIILAAGQSKRFGPDNKLLHSVGGEPLLGRVLGAFEGVGLCDFVVVTGHERERIEPLVRDCGARSVFNPEYAEGMGGSLACGFRSLDGSELDGVLVCLGDLPGMNGGLVRQVGAGFEAALGRRVVQPTYLGRRGHPVCFPSRCFEQLRSLAGDCGAREVLKAEGESVLLLEVGEDGCVRDMDTP